MLTVIRFRSDVEKFLLWSFLIAVKPLGQLKKSDVLSYADFFLKPPQSWITLTNVDKFQLDGGLYTVNKAWRPFRYIAEGSETDKKKYREGCF